MKYLFLILLSFSFAACGSSSSSSGNNSPQGSTASVNTSQLGTRYDFQFTFEANLAGGTILAANNQDYTLPIYIKENGIVSVVAAQFPPVALRVCGSSSTRRDCDVRMTQADVLGNNAADLVFDACGTNGEDRADEDCGSDSDSSVYRGFYDAGTGKLYINALNIRVRLFFADSNGLTVYEERVEDSGFLPMDSILARLTTDDELGNPVEENGFMALVARDTIPTGFPEVGGEDYEVVLEGAFVGDAP